MYLLGRMKGEAFDPEIRFFAKRERRKDTPPPNPEICCVFGIFAGLFMSL